MEMAVSLLAFGAWLVRQRSTTSIPIPLSDPRDPRRTDAPWQFGATALLVNRTAAGQSVAVVLAGPA